MNQNTENPKIAWNQGMPIPTRTDIWLAVYVMDNGRRRVHSIARKVESKTRPFWQWNRRFLRPLSYLKSLSSPMLCRAVIFWNMTGWPSSPMLCHVVNFQLKSLTSLPQSLGHVGRGFVVYTPPCMTDPRGQKTELSSSAVVSCPPWAWLDNHWAVAM